MQITGLLAVADNSGAPSDPLLRWAVYFLLCGIGLVVLGRRWKKRYPATGKAGLGSMPFAAKAYSVIGWLCVAFGGVCLAAAIV